MNLFFKQIILFCFFFCAGQLKAQVKFSTSLSESVISRDENTTLRILLVNADNIQSISPPSFKDIILISGPFQETGIIDLNGVPTNYFALNFIIKTTGPGRFRIPGAIAKISGKVYKSNPVELLVKKTRSANPNTAAFPPVVQGLTPMPDSRPRPSFNDYIFKEGENVPEKVNKNMQLRLEVNKKSCYVGEPVIATYKLYTRLKSESKLTENPSFNGFSVIDLQAPDVMASSTEKLNGRDYNVYTIRKAQLYPLQDGTIELESAELENKVKFIRDSYARNNPSGLSQLFDEFANATVPADAEINQTVSLRSKPVNIAVKPLPEEGKPASFKGAVGSFALEAVLEKNNFTTDQSGRLVVSVSGSGNLQLMTAPVVSWPQGIEYFDPKSTDNLNMAAVPVTGIKDFAYTFSVDKPGEYTIPAIHFSYFDPAKKEYKVLDTKPIPFTVYKGNGIAAQQMSLAATPEVKSTLYDMVFRNRKWLVLIIAVLIFTGLGIYWKKENKQPPKQKDNRVPVSLADEGRMDAIVEASSQNQQNPLAGSEKCLYDAECVEFYSLLNTEVKNFLAQKFRLTPGDVNKKMLSEKMDKQHISNETVLLLQQLLQDIEWQLYTPFERNEKMEQLYQRAHGLLQLINTYDAKSL